MKNDKLILYLSGHTSYLELCGECQFVFTCLDTSLVLWRKLFHFFVSRNTTCLELCGDLRFHYNYLDTPLVLGGEWQFELSGHSSCLVPCGVWLFHFIYLSTPPIQSYKENGNSVLNIWARLLSKAMWRTTIPLYLSGYTHCQKLYGVWLFYFIYLDIPKKKKAVENGYSTLYTWTHFLSKTMWRMAFYIIHLDTLLV